MDGLIVDDQYENTAGDVIENRLTWPSVGRKDLSALFTCQAFNTKLEMKKSSVVLDLIRKCLLHTIYFLQSIAQLSDQL